ncbi:MAG: hypothetical protein JW788_06620 [Candidatus Omnitrophica bacterium]|nr:hypothetical protein [Candidatus Omnitrophota bacterium]
MNPDVDKFRYSFTAFLAASRSLTLIMQKEFSKVSGFDSWYTKKQKEMNNNSILKYLLRQRNITSHERPVFPIGIISATGQGINGTQVGVFLIGTGTSTDFSGSFMKFSADRPNTTVTYRFDDIPDRDKDVVTICQEAIDLLERIVTECEEKFLRKK